MWLLLLRWQRCAVARSGSVAVCLTLKSKRAAMPARGRAVCGCRVAPFVRRRMFVACLRWSRAARGSNAQASPRVPPERSAPLRRGTALTDVCCRWVRRPVGVTGGGDTAPIDEGYTSSAGIQANGRAPSRGTANCPSGCCCTSSAQRSGDAGLVTSASGYVVVEQQQRGSVHVHRLL